MNSVFELDIYVNYSNMAHQVNLMDVLCFHYSLSYGSPRRYQN